MNSFHISVVEKDVVACTWTGYDLKVYACKFKRERTLRNDGYTEAVWTHTGDKASSKYWAVLCKTFLETVL